MAVGEELVIDGSRGEGGGQILRSSLSLAAVTGRGVRIERIRARRRRPGLRRQHLTAVRAVAGVCGAEVEGDHLGSSAIRFSPGPVRSGDYAFSVGTAGSATLVLQAVLPPLLAAPGRSTVSVEGGTHNPKAPPFEFLARCYLPQLERMGATVQAELDRHGFYPAGGGRITATVEPGPLRPLELDETTPVRRRRARCLLVKLPAHIARRELGVVRDRLGFRDDDCHLEEVGGHHGPSNVLMLEVGRDDVTEIVTAFGEMGRPAEKVAAGAVAELRQYLDADVPVGAHLADQLLLPIALAGAGRFRTLQLSRHSWTNIEVIRRFVDVDIRVDEYGPASVVSVGRP